MSPFRLRRWLGPALLAGGAGLVAAAVVGRSAQLSLVLIFPVVTGNSLEFLLGILLIFLGFVAVPLSWSDGDLPPDSIPRRASLGGSEGSSSSTSGGGVILVGPFPIFFGAWRNRGWRSFALAAAIGAVLFALVALYFLGLL